MKFQIPDITYYRSIKNAETIATLLIEQGYEVEIRDEDLSIRVLSRNDCAFKSLRNGVTTHWSKDCRIIAIEDAKGITYMSQIMPTTIQTRARAILEKLQKTA